MPDAVVPAARRREVKRRHARPHLVRVRVRVRVRVTAARSSVGTRGRTSASLGE